jgi:hypothetical protein
LLLPWLCFRGGGFPNPDPVPNPGESDRYEMMDHAMEQQHPRLAGLSAINLDEG